MSSTNTERKRRPNSWLVTLPLLAVSLTFVFWYFGPRQADLRQLQSELELKEVSLAYSTLPAQIRSAQQVLIETGDFVQAWRSNSATPLADVFSEISQIIADSGSKATSFDPEPAVEWEFLRRVPLTVAFEGSFQQVFDVLLKLEQMSQPMWILSLHFEKARKRGNESIVACELKLAIFTGKTNSND